MARRGVKKIVRELDPNEELDLAAAAAWEVMRLLVETVGGFDNGEKLVRYRRLNYQQLKDSGNVEACAKQDEAVELWKVIVEQGKTVWRMLHRVDQEDDYHFACIRLDEEETIDQMIGQLHETAIVQACVIAGQVQRFMHAGELDLQGKRVQYEYVNFCEKKVQVIIVSAKDPWKRGPRSYIEIRKKYGWQHATELLEQRVEWKANWIRVRAAEMGLMLEHVNPDARLESMRLRWNVELACHGKRFKNLCAVYLSALASDRVSNYCTGQIGPLSERIPNPKMLDGNLVEWRMCKNHGEGPKVEPVDEVETQVVG